MLEDFKVTEKDTFYEITYPKAIGANSEGLEKITPSIATLNIKKADLERKKWTIESKDLWTYIQNGLKKLVGIDFDLTLSNIHTFYKGDDLSETNLKGGTLTKQILSAIHAKTDLYLFVVTSNYQDTVKEHLDAWKINQFFREIKGREDFHGKGSDKEYCFWEIYNTLMKNSALNIDKCLDLNVPEKPIDIIGAVIIDDDKNIEQFERFGIKPLKVDPAPNDVKHWETFEIDYLTIPSIQTKNSEQPGVEAKSKRQKFVQ